MTTPVFPGLPSEGPGIHVGAPSGWVAADVAPPELSGAAGAVITQWSAVTSPAHDGTLATACIATKIPGWVEDMRGPIEARNVGVTASVAERLAGAPVELAPAGPDRFDVRVAASAGAAPLGTARTFVGFDGASRVATCFVACVASAKADRSGAAPACDASVAGAKLEGSVAPPPPGAALRTAAWAVHHPGQTATYGAVLVAATAVLAVTSRRKPRARIWRGR